MDNNSCTTAFNLLKEDFPKFQQTITSFIYISFEFLRHCVTSRWKNSRARTPLKTNHKPTDSSHSDSWTRVHTARPSRRIAEINGRKGSINPSKKTEGVGGGAYFSLSPARNRESDRVKQPGKGDY